MQVGDSWEMGRGEEKGKRKQKKGERERRHCLFTQGSILPEAKPTHKGRVEIILFIQKPFIILNTVLRA